MNDPNLDINELAEGKKPQKTVSETDHQEQQPDDQAEIQVLVPTSKASQSVVVQSPDIAWIEATQSLQTSLVRSLQDYKATWSQRRALSSQRERMITEVADQYVTYLREEAKLASKAALEARGSILRQELTRLKSQLFIDLAEVTGSSLKEIERIAQSYSAELTSPAIQQAYAKYIMTKIFDLLEQPS